MGVIKEIQDDINNAALRIVGEYRQRLLFEAKALCGDASEAEDLVMLTFDTVFRNIGAYDESKGEFYPWMVGVLRRVYAKYDRRKVNRGTTPLQLEELEKLTVEDNTTIDELLRNSDSAALRAAIDRLDPEYRRVLVMHYFQELPFKEIAAILKAPIGTVLWRASVARKMLGEKLRVELGDSKAKKLAILAALFLSLASLAAWQAVEAFSDDEPVQPAEQVEEQIADTNLTQTTTTTDQEGKTMNKKVMTGFSTMALALSAAAADTFWQGGAGAWNSDNWSAGVPTASQNAIIKASGSDVTLEGDAGSAATLTVGYLLKAPVKLSIKTDLAVTSLRVANLTNKSEGEIEQTSGAVTVSSTGEAVIIGGGNSDHGLYTIRGKNSSLSVAGRIIFSRYQGGWGEMIVEDGATLTAGGLSGCVGAGLGGHGALRVRNGATATLGSVNLSGGATGILDVSNATVNVTGTIEHSQLADTDYSTIAVHKDGVLTVGGAITFGRYNNGINGRFLQEPGSDVNLASIKLGSALYCKNISYDMLGGTLDLTGSFTLADASRLNIESGTVTIGGSLYIDNYRSAFAESCARFAGDSVTDITGTLYFHQNYGNGGIVAIETEGGSFTAKAAALNTCTVSKHDKLIFRPIITETGVAPIEITGNVTLPYTLYVQPQAKKGAKGGTWTILEWGGKLTLQNSSEIVLDSDVDPSCWTLLVDTENKRVQLKYTTPGLVIMVR